MPHNAFFGVSNYVTAIVAIVIVVVVVVAVWWLRSRRK
jgi:sensor domain CHASE-containing protein